MRIVTWNMQGGTNAMYINQVLAQTHANVLCLQETGNMTPLLHGTVPFGGFPNSLFGNFSVGGNFFETIFWSNAYPLTQYSLAVMTNLLVEGHGIMAPAVGLYNPANPRALPWLDVYDPHGGTRLRVYSVHAPPVWGTVTTAQVCSWNEAQVTAVAGAAAGVLWTIAGDFNADPTAQGFVAPTVGAVVRGQNATQQGGGILDYSVTNAGVGYTFVAPSQLVGASDHYPQEFNW